MKINVSVSGAIVIAGLVALAVGERYFTTKHWSLNNILGVCFILQGISMFSIGSFKIAAALLVGLFFYDVFWVFGTPVMVTVAKKVSGEERNTNVTMPPPSPQFLTSLRRSSHKKTARRPHQAALSPVPYPQRQRQGEIKLREYWMPTRNLQYFSSCVCTEPH